MPHEMRRITRRSHSDRSEWRTSPRRSPRSRHHSYSRSPSSGRHRSRSVSGSRSSHNDRDYRDYRSSRRSASPRGRSLDDKARSRSPREISPSEEKEHKSARRSYNPRDDDDAWDDAWDEVSDEAWNDDSFVTEDSEEVVQQIETLSQSSTPEVGDDIISQQADREAMFAHLRQQIRQEMAPEMVKLVTQHLQQRMDKMKQEVTNKLMAKLMDMLAAVGIQHPLVEELFGQCGRHSPQKLESGKDSSPSNVVFEDIEEKQEFPGTKWSKSRRRQSVDVSGVTDTTFDGSVESPKWTELVSHWATTMSSEETICIRTPGIILGYPGNDQKDITILRDDILQFLNKEEIGATVVQICIIWLHEKTRAMGIESVELCCPIAVQSLGHSIKDRSNFIAGFIHITKKSCYLVPFIQDHH